MKEFEDLMLSFQNKGNTLHDTFLEHVSQLKTSLDSDFSAVHLETFVTEVGVLLEKYELGIEHLKKSYHLFVQKIRSEQKDQEILQQLYDSLNKNHETIL